MPVGLWIGDKLAYICYETLVWKYNSPDITHIKIMTEGEFAIALSLGMTVNPEISMVETFVSNSVLNDGDGIPVKLSEENYHRFLDNLIDEDYYHNIRAIDKYPLAHHNYAILYDLALNGTLPQFKRAYNEYDGESMVKQCLEPRHLKIETYHDEDENSCINYRTLFDGASRNKRPQIFKFLINNVGEYDWNFSCESHQLARIVSWDDPEIVLRLLNHYGGIDESPIYSFMSDNMINKLVEVSGKAVNWEINFARIFVEKVNALQIPECDKYLDRIDFDSTNIVEYLLSGVFLQWYTNAQFLRMKRLLRKVFNHNPDYPLYKHIHNFHSHFTGYLKFLYSMPYEMPLMSIIHLLIKSGHGHHLVKLIEDYTIKVPFDTLGSIKGGSHSDKSISRFYLMNILQWVLDYGRLNIITLIEKRFGGIDKSIWVFDDLSELQLSTRSDTVKWYEIAWSKDPKNFMLPNYIRNLRAQIIVMLNKSKHIVINDSYWTYFLTHPIPAKFIHLISCPEVGLVE